MYSCLSINLDVFTLSQVCVIFMIMKNEICSWNAKAKRRYVYNPINIFFYRAPMSVHY